MIALNRVIDLPASPEKAWDLLWNVPALAECLPGCQDVSELEPRRRYRATIRDRVGPFRVSIPLDIVVESVAPGERLTIAASGRDSTLGSPVKVRLGVSLVPCDDGARLTLDGEGELGGKLAALGQAVAERKTRETLDRFAENLKRLLGVPREVGGLDGPPTPPALGTGPGDPGRSSIPWEAPREVGGLDGPPTPPALGTGPGNPGRSSTAPTPPALGTGPGDPGRSSIPGAPDAAAV